MGKYDLTEAKRGLAQHMLNRYSEEIARLVSIVDLLKCLFCESQDITIVALFEPDAAASQKFWAAIGKRQHILYGLCPNCGPLDSAADEVFVKRVENKIIEIHRSTH